jgi:Pentapeptide repeats (8 copies)
VAAFLLLWWLLPPLLYAGVAAGDVRVKAITDTRTAFLAGLVGLGALGAFWLNSRIYRITARSFEVTERGHVTDRYSKAIEQLGSDSLDVRLGGVYALEQIAKDTKNSALDKDDQATIVEVLSAFVRVHSDPVNRLKAEKPRRFKDFPETEVAVQAASYAKDIKPSEDVQAAVTVLGRLPFIERVSRGDLTGAILRYLVLRRGEGHLLGVSLRQADLAHADLSWANLVTANLAGADLTGAKLANAKLAGAIFPGANLNGALLYSADLAAADLTEADLTGANLNSAVLTRADLTRAQLAGADLSTSRGLTQAQLDQAFGDAKTQLPPGLSCPWRP